MKKNVLLKRTLKSSIFKIATIINKFIPKDDGIVLLYSANKGGIQFSLVPLRDYMIEHDFHKRYRIVCGVENLNDRDNAPLEFVDWIGAYKLFFRAKHVFYSAGQIPIKPSKNQCVIHLRHGNVNFKKAGKLTKINNGDEFFFTYMAASAPYFKSVMAKEYGCSEDNIAVVGDPLIDQLFKNIPDKYAFSEYKKVILWLPTFRQSDYLGYDDSSLENLVPLFEEVDYPQLNELLKKHNIKLIVKLHPSQKNFKGGKRHFSHFDIYTHSEFLDNNYDVNEMMIRADSLIGDYSSASMQYLILDRPQAFVVPDIMEYAEKRGFVFDNPEDYMGGHIIKTIDQFNRFIYDISSDKDIYKEKRHRVCNAVYMYQDNKNCQRIVELSGMK